MSPGAEGVPGFGRYPFLFIIPHAPGGEKPLDRAKMKALSVGAPRFVASPAQISEGVASGRAVALLVFLAAPARARVVSADARLEVFYRWALDLLAIHEHPAFTVSLERGPLAMR